MAPDPLPVPARLTALLEVGLWPRNSKEANAQNFRLLIPIERVKRIAPEENAIYLCSPPFPTIAQEAGGAAFKFWEEYGVLRQISPELSLMIGDFGLGSDTAIILDYREPDYPPVLRLRWSGANGCDNSWIKCARNFDEFADLIGLDVDIRNSEKK